MNKGKTALYRHFGSNSELLYIGVSLNAINRLGQHSDHSDWFNLITRVDMEWFDSRVDALNAERDAITKEKPTHNIHHNKQLKPKEKGELDRCVKVQEYIYKTVNIPLLNNLSSTGEALGVSGGTIRRYIDLGLLGSIKLPSATAGAKPVEKVSGWQILDFIEALEAA